MAEKKRNNLIRSVCGGLNRRFRGVTCNYYDCSAIECRLLRKQQMEEFWQKCRFNKFKMLYKASAHYLKQFKLKYDNIPVDDMEDIDFKGIINRLEKQGLKEDFTINGWRKYMNKTVYREVKGILVKKGLIPREAKCGTCKYLPVSKPYVCQKKGENRKKTDHACGEYTPRIDIFISVSHNEDSEHNGNQGKNPLESEMIRAQHENIRTPERILEEKQESNQLPIIKKLLKNRAENTNPGTRERKIYERQYNNIIQLQKLFSKGISEKKALKILADETSVDIKTIQRDLKEIRKFLKKMSTDG